MAVTAFEGPAGTGKTHSLMDDLEGRVREHALASHQRVLALTFMHGARRRLDSRLSEIDRLGGRYQAVTVDSFAWRLVQRWRRLAASLGYAIPSEDRCDETCALAATLMARPDVRTWVALSYPLMLVDEAQDLSAERCAMVSEAATSAHVTLAYDEFQCLNPILRPTPIQTWLQGVCRPVLLTKCRRTNDAELLAAARAVRDGRALNQNGRRFKVVLTPGRPNLAATYLTNFIAWRDGGRVAVLTPSRRGGFADKVVDLVCTRSLGKHQNGPYQIEWESGDESEGRYLRQILAVPDQCSIPEALAALDAHAGLPVVKAATEWIARRKRVLGVDEITADEIHRYIDRTLATRRRYGITTRREFVGMTVQQAKNREFEHVVVIWPYTIPNDNEQKRRLLYNAITRAQRSCLVLVQGQELLAAPPFVAC
jgi:UvrD-like helicase C-terminal domain/AAA domain